MATFQKRQSKLHGIRWKAEVFKNGTRKSETFDTKSQAVAWATALEAELTREKRGEIPDKTFGDLLQRYAEEVSPTKRGNRWEVIRIGLLRRDRLSDVKLSELDSRHVVKWRDSRLAGSDEARPVSASSVCREWNLLSAACNVAIKEWQWMRSNPFHDVRRPTPAKPRERRLSPQEIESLCHALGYTPEGSLETVTSRVGAAMLFAIETAMRAGEICWIPYGHADLERQTCFLPAEVCKNGHARTVPLSREAVRILKQLPKVEDGAPAFGLATSQIDALFRKGKSRALITHLHFHDTRREALSRMARKVDCFQLAKISGHRDMKILLNTYYAEDQADVALLLG